MTMIRRAKDNAGTAVLERTGNPDEIAARVAAADAEARRAAVVADIEQFRGIVSGIADGIEPDGKTLAAIGDLARRLRLPTDAVSRAVKAMQDERRLQAQVDDTKARLADVKAREVELAAEMKAAEAKLLALREEVAEYHALHRGYPYLVQAVSSVKGENPLLFSPVDVVAERLIKADGGMSIDTLKGMVPDAANVYRVPSITMH